MLRKTILLTIIVCCAAQLSIASERVYFADGRVSFIPPAGFQRLTQEEIAQTYIRARPPQHVFANQRRSVSVAITFSRQDLLPEGLPEYKEAMEATLPRLIPGLRWLTREFVTISGRRWVHFEMTSHAIDTDIHSHLYSTSFDGKVLLFAFNATVENYAGVREQLEASKDSIILRDSTRSHENTLPRGSGVVTGPEPSQPAQAQSPSACPEQPHAQVSGGVLNGRAISKPAPPYPPVARASRASGVVVVRIVYDEEGRVVWACAVSGHPLLREAAREAALRATFPPTTVSGSPVRVSGVVTYNFVL